MNSKDEQMKQIQKLIVEFVKQFGPSSGKQLLNITDYIAKPVLQAQVDDYIGKLELLIENVVKYQNSKILEMLNVGKENPHKNEKNSWWKSKLSNYLEISKNHPW
ncbi:Hypothetical protein GCW_90643 [Mycoplasmoides gallisepticum S6]|uniref:Mobile element protein n=3 Tax=Mycoplasmoides gallisepticum TaxID=2096 RepID=A0A0F6CLU1_MYCGL|nr:hypothetical protein [Mycoplasmoides gallisepticum]AHV85393.1 Mobile element protein [Mycoplasmoides gallisepticum S6]AHV85395.1 Hypothetical protein GCW_90643 [Mycoplasmoides gallisepticum S6]